MGLQNGRKELAAAVDEMAIVTRGGGEFALHKGLEERHASERVRSHVEKLTTDIQLHDGRANASAFHAESGVRDPIESA